MKKYEWLREEALHKPITRNDMENLWGFYGAPVYSVTLLFYAVSKFTLDDDYVSLRIFLNNGWLCPNEILVEDCRITATGESVTKRARGCERELIDAGAEYSYHGVFSVFGNKFIESRNLARLAAMLTLRGMRQMPLLRDVAPMVARLIWESRGYYLDLMK